MVTLILALLIGGFVMYLVQTAPWIHSWIKKAVIGLICFILLIYTLHFFGVATGFKLKL